MKIQIINPLRNRGSASQCSTALHTGLLSIALACSSTVAYAKHPARGRTEQVSSARRLANANTPHLSEERSGVMTTRNGLRLRIVADQGDIAIRTSNETSSPENAKVTYRIRIETDARTINAKDLLKQYVLSVRSTPTGVQIVGEMPKGALREHVAGNYPASLPRLRVNYQVNVPRDYSIEVSTQGGNIETQDINGTATLLTRGGNITAGRIGFVTRSASYSGFPAGKLQGRLETQGGHIFVSDVAGDLRAITAGGHITVGNIQGEAILRSGGGHIRAGEITGKVLIDTAGGNISVQHAGGNVSASTTGGQIDFGEASGSVRAHTGGGGIRILHVAGPIQLETSDGSICLTRVQGTVRASTGSGTITAWINPDATPSTGPPASAASTERRTQDRGPREAIESVMHPARIKKAAPGELVRLSGASQLESGQGDIIVFLPRHLAANIEATIEKAADHRIEADPALPLKIFLQNPAGSHGGNTIRAEGALNGGGELLRLRTVSGNIRLKFFDADPALHDTLVRQQRTRLERQKRVLEQRTELTRETEDAQAVDHQSESEASSDSGHAGETEHPAEGADRAPSGQGDNGQRDSSLFGQWGRKLEMRVWGVVRVSPEELQKHLIKSVKPDYPEIAKHAGIDGPVQLEIVVNKEGGVDVRKALTGERLLVNAAIAAVKQWRYSPVVLAGKPVNAISTVALEFRLR
jgi:TonB family protein